MSLLGIERVLECAMLIEKNGESFYHKLSQLSENKNHRKIFQVLADEENQHLKIFAKMRDEFRDLNFPQEDINNQEYEEYMGRVSKEILFNESGMQEVLTQKSDTISAVQFAIKMELDTIIFYADMKVYLPQSQVEIMDAILGEERKHAADLEKLKKELLKHQIK